VALLKRHADTADSSAYEPPEDELRGVRERILEKLQRLRERTLREEADGSVSAVPPGVPLLEQAAGTIETKAGRDKIGLIEWGISRASSTAFGGPSSGEDLCHSA
jgi:hypothetical protein